MKAHGWSKEQLFNAVFRASHELTLADTGDYAQPIQIEVRDLCVWRSSSDGPKATQLQFKLGFYRVGRRRRDGSYPPGVGVRETWTSKFIQLPVPESEMEQIRVKNLLYHKIWVKHNRSTGRLCYHANGIFMREMFKINPYGKIITAHAVYDTEKGFDRMHPNVGTMNIGSMAYPLQFREACRCVDYGIFNF